MSATKQATSDDRCSGRYGDICMVWYGGILVKSQSEALYFQQFFFNQSEALMTKNLYLLINLQTKVLRAVLSTQLVELVS